MTHYLIWSHNGFRTTMKMGRDEECFTLFGGRVTSFVTPLWRMECPASRSDFDLTIYVNGEVHNLRASSNLLAYEFSFNSDVRVDYFFDDKQVYTDITGFLPNIFNRQFIGDFYNIVYRGYTLHTKYMVLQIGAFLILYDKDSMIAGIATGKKNMYNINIYILFEILWARDADLVRSFFLYHGSSEAVHL